MVCLSFWYYCESLLQENDQLIELNQELTDEVELLRESQKALVDDFEEETVNRFQFMCHE